MAKTVDEYLEDVDVKEHKSPRNRLPIFVGLGVMILVLALIGIGVWIWG
jgi:flagellar biogenesis protein FliO